MQGAILATKASVTYPNDVECYDKQRGASKYMIPYYCQWNASHSVWYYLKLHRIKIFIDTIGIQEAGDKGVGNERVQSLPKYL